MTTAATYKWNITYRSLSIWSSSTKCFSADRWLLLDLQSKVTCDPPDSCFSLFPIVIILFSVLQNSFRSSLLYDFLSFFSHSVDQSLLPSRHPLMSIFICLVPGTLKLWSTIPPSVFTAAQCFCLQMHDQKAESLREFFVTYTPLQSFDYGAFPFYNKSPFCNRTTLHFNWMRFKIFGYCFRLIFLMISAFLFYVWELISCSVKLTSSEHTDLARFKPINQRSATFRARGLVMATSNGQTAKTVYSE